VRGSNRSNPGLSSIANTASDIVVAEILDTNPSKAMEGARDTAKFKVVRTLKGPLKPDDEADVYYHLLWTNTEKWILEPPKFEKGKRYTLFLTKDGSRKLHYTLADQWLAVAQDHPEFDKDILVAVNEVASLWGDEWRKQHKHKSGREPLPSDLRIEIVPEAKAIPSKQGLALPVKIINHSTQEISTKLTHEWHSGLWPPTNLYAMTARTQPKFVPVYLINEKNSEPESITIAAGKSVSVTLRLDWPGTGAQKAAPILNGVDSIRVMLVFDVGRNALEYATSALTHIEIAQTDL
jgi:hypothetical protein